MRVGSFRLDAAQRSDLERLVRGCGVKDWGKALSELRTGVEGSIVAWMELKALQVTPQDVAQLSGLVALLTASSQPSIGLIRTRVAALSLGIVREIEGRASRLSDHAPRFHPIGLGLKTWAESLASAPAGSGSVAVSLYGRGRFSRPRGGRGCLCPGSFGPKGPVPARSSVFERGNGRGNYSDAQMQTAPRFRSYVFVMIERKIGCGGAQPP
jgi:hypothetical protein